MRVLKIQPGQTCRPKRLTSFTLLLSACVVFNACGVLSGGETYVVQVDSVTVAPPALSTGAVRTTYFGHPGSACAKLDKVERQMLAADTLQIRFIGRSGSGNCIQIPYSLRYEDSLPNAPARTVHLVVQQPSGAALRYEIVLPLTQAR